MPGSGKSYVGKKLADNLGYQFIELDSILEQEYNLPLQAVLETLGDDSFLKKQAEDAISNTQNRNDLVVSPGGSIVYTAYAMEHLKDISTIIYLKSSLETIRKRIAEFPRGVVGLKTKTLAELYQERILLYEKYASIFIDAEQAADQVVSDILTRIDG